MNGSITFKSEYGRGSEFKAVIPQGIDSETAFAAVEEPEKKKVLVYEGRAVYARSLCWSLENLGVPYVMTGTLDDFTQALLREEWYYVFSGYGLYEGIKQLMEQATFPSGIKPPLALMVEWENEAHIPNVRFVSLPVQSLSIANVLNGKADFRSYFNTRNDSLLRFTYPGARLLIVDDISANLRVAEGLLAPYHAKVDTCLSGIRAIELVKQHEYDIVFMDHMMSEMDGIEATDVIRAWEGERRKANPQLKAGTDVEQAHVPIIALTANAISGMREMFIEKGFSDFLAKPIDISKLDEILARWIDKEKRGIRNEELGIRSEGLGIRNEEIGIRGVDIKQGIAMTGGTVVRYRQVLDSFCKDIEERLPVLKSVPEAAVLPEFTTQVHALKSVLFSIGAAETSIMAAKLEAAGKAGDIEYIRINLPGFAEQLVGLREGVRAWESAEKEREEEGEQNKGAVVRLLHGLVLALEAEKIADIDKILEELTLQKMDTEMKEALEKISDDVLIAEYGNAAEIVSSLLKGWV
jgi:CheY-like chemotaxis protein/HPt (histidine-containing phosphotransfer) domain-containing protein